MAFQTDLNVGIVILSSVMGYLVGSISFARVVAHWRAPLIDITRTDVPIPHTDSRFRMNGVSGTSVTVQLGQRWGFFAGFLDWLKVFVPALGLRLAFPSEPYFLIYAATCAIGHNWPAYYKFKGGYGLSAICAGTMVADFPILIPGLVIIFGITALLNKITNRFHISAIAGTLCLLPWFWLHTHDWWYIFYAAIVNIAYIVKIIPDMKATMEAKTGQKA
jgi:glycerol-3-phosphate acyltransferase PlsY